MALTTIRHARMGDLPAVSALLAETWHATYDALYGPARVAALTRRWHAAEALAREVDAPDRRLLVAERAERIVGTASVRLTGDAVRLDRLYVLPEAQGHGLGAELLGAALGAFPDAARMSLEVEPANAGAIRFYERHGFRVTGRTADCAGTGDGIPAVMMSRERTDGYDTRAARRPTAG
jgi:ribosomal protein S18 acetylase RimI-like enzyme